jgi:hypothetical protein
MGKWQKWRKAYSGIESLQREKFQAIGRLNRENGVRSHRICPHHDEQGNKNCPFMKGQFLFNRSNGETNEVSRAAI